MKSVSSIVSVRSVLLFSLLVGACSSDALVARDRAQGVSADGGTPVSPGAAPGSDAGPAVPAYVQPCDPSAPPIPSIPGSLCESDGWCWDSPQPSGRDVRSIAPYGSGLIAATRGGLVRYDGTTWSKLDSQLNQPFAAWGAPSGEVFALDLSGLARFDGTTWTASPSPLITPVAGDLQGTSAKNVWAIMAGSGPGGDAGAVAAAKILRFDGASWREVQPPLPLFSAQRLQVLSDTDVWAYGGDRLGDGNRFAHFDGSAWTEHELPAGEPVRALWGSSSTDVWIGTFANGEPVESNAPEAVPGSTHNFRGVIYRFDGTRFTKVELPVVSEITEIWGKSASDVWIGTETGDHLHWDGSTVTLTSSPFGLRRVLRFAETKDGKLFAAGAGPSDGWEYSGSISSWDGAAWKEDSATGSMDYAKKVWGSAWNDVWAVGTRGLRLHFDGKSWKMMPKGAATITGIWGKAKDDVWTVNVDGAIEHFDGAAWTTVYETGTSLSAIWGIGNGEVWVGASHDNRAFVGHFDGKAYTEHDAGLVTVTAVWASSTKDVWAGGAGGVRRFDGASWTNPVSPGDGFFDANAIWGSSASDVWVANSGFALAHYDGKVMSLVAPLMDDSDQDVALSGCGDHDVFLADADGIGHFDGRTWTVTPMYTNRLTGLWAGSSKFAVTVGWGGQILRRSE